MGHYLQATVSFPGIKYPIRASYTLAHGQQPGRIIITCEPQPINLLAGAIGPVVFRWRDQQVTLRDCRVFSHNFAGSGEAGYELNLFLMDRRWKWANLSVFGRYNDRTADQSIYLPRKKSARELGRILFDAMKESRYNVEGLPSDDWPVVEWYGSKASEELSRLCDQYGCRIVMQWDGSIAIRKVGEGQPLPLNLPAGNNSESLDVPVLPDTIECHFGNTKYRVDSLLQEAGLDINGQYKPVNDLSYAPKRKFDGSLADPAYPWDGECPGNLPLFVKNLPGGATPQYGDNLYRYDLAKRSLFRAYQITTRMPSPTKFEGVPLKIPGYKGDVTDIGQLLPIDDTLYNVTQAISLDGVTDDGERPEDQKNGRVYEDFWNINDLAMVYGSFYKKDASFIGGYHTDDWPDAFNFKRKHPSRNSYRPGGFSIDRERGIVMFDETVHRLKPRNAAIAGVSANNNNVYAFPRLGISFMASVRNKKDFSPDHYVVKRTVSNNPIGTGPLVIVHPEYQLIVTSELPGGSPDYPNKSMLDEIGKYYIDFIVRQYQLKRPRTITYSGLWPINPDGAIVEVTLSVGENGGDTVASYNNEHSLWQPTYMQKRVNERIAAGFGGNNIPPVFVAPPQNFPYNMGSVYQNTSLSRRG